MALAVTMTTVVPAGGTRGQEAGAKAGIAVKIKMKLFLALARYGDIASALIKSDAAVKSEVDRCLKMSMTNGRKSCKTNTIPILFVGDGNNEVRDHIHLAQTKRGKPRIVTKNDRTHSRRWLEKHKGPGKACPNVSKGSVECDEYPMASNVEGGEGKASLMSVSASQNHSVGGFVGALHKHCVPVYGKYIVQPIFGVYETGYFCNR